MRALELDINEDWTSFITYRHPGAGDPSNLLPEMFRPAGTLFDPRRTRFLRRLPAAGAEMVRLPRDVSPGARARRALLADFLVASLLAAVAILLAAGIGVVGFVALLVLLLLLLWIGVEASLRRWVRRGKARERPSRNAGARRRRTLARRSLTNPQCRLTTP